MIDLNVRTLTDLSLAFVNSLARRKGGILNVASIAGFMPGPGMAVYYATKAYVLSFSEALHSELAKKGVRVTTVCPGVVPSEFQARAGARHVSYPWPLTHSPEEIAVLGYEGLKAGRRLVIPGTGNRLVRFVLRFAPHAVLLPAVRAHNLRQ